MRCGQKMALTRPNLWNSRSFWLGGVWASFAIMNSPCDNDYVCWINPWPWGGTATTEDYR